MPKFTLVTDELFQWTDSCNVFVFRFGERAILFDLGDGSVLDHLHEIGVKHVAYVLFTHHHREQCGGGKSLAELKIPAACGAGERAFFEKPTEFRKWRPKLSDPFTVHGASYVRPPVHAIPITRSFKKMDTFTFHGNEIVCIETPGNSPGSMSYCLRFGSRWIVFSGDVMLDRARMHTWFDTEWDYGFAAGIYALGNSAEQIAGYRPAMLCPSHGSVIHEPRVMLEEYVAKLRTLAQYYVRGYDIQRFAGADQDRVSQPSEVPHLWRLSKHLYKFRGPNYWVNFAMILSDSGRALFVDCGLFDREFLDHTIALMRERLGLRAIDAIFVTHIHGDHALEAEHVRKKYGAKLWGMTGVVDKFEHPFDYDLAALLPMYGKEDSVPLKFDRTLADGESFSWEGFQFTCDWMPGQTKYHSCLHGEIDGKIVAFTGDNVFAASDDTTQGGNECVVARNGGVLEEGYLYAANYLHALGPDLLIGGHCWAIENPKPLARRLRERILKLREAFSELCPEEDYRLTFDPYRVEAFPYRIRILPGASGEVVIRVRNWLERKTTYRLALDLPGGLHADRSILTGELSPGGFQTHRVKLTADANASEGLRMVAIDTVFDGRRLGAWYDFLVLIGNEPAPLTTPAAAKPAAGY